MYFAGLNRSSRRSVQTPSDTTTNVAFYAHLSSSHSTTGLRQPIKFEKVVTNVGSAYHPTNGIFEVPMSGVYVFFWNILNDHNADIHTTLASTQGQLGNTFTERSSGLTGEGSGFVVAHLNAGVHVWVEKAEAYGNFLQAFSSFSGFLLYVDQ